MRKHEKHKKLTISVRYWLQGSKYFMAAEALHFAGRYHKGSRKDNTTPEFFHQIGIVQYLRTLEGSLMYPEHTYAVALLHDVVEDYPVTIDQIKAQFGGVVAHSVQLISKKKDDVTRSLKEYYEGMKADPISSVVKGADRINNFQSMVGVFTFEKQRRYISEARRLLLPMLKEARRRYPAQEAAYENVKYLLDSQICLIEQMHRAGQVASVS